MRDREYRQLRADPPMDRRGPTLLGGLIALNIAIYCIQLIFAFPTREAPSPAGFVSLGELQAGHWWTLFTHLFVHQDIIHLSSNMVLLLMVGRSVLNLAGPLHFAGIYFLGGILGAVMQLLSDMGGPSSTQLVGASGAVFAVMGAFAVLRPDYNITDLFSRWVSFSLGARSVIICTIFVEICLGILVRFIPEDNGFPGMGVAHLCHDGGGVLGLAYAMRILPKWYPPVRRRPAPTREWLLAPEEDEELPFVPAGRALRSESSRTQRLHHYPSMPPEPLTNQEFLAEEVNPILDKLHEKGIESLTPAEKNILAEAARRLNEGK